MFSAGLIDRGVYDDFSLIILPHLPTHLFKSGNTSIMLTAALLIIRNISIEMSFGGNGKVKLPLLGRSL